MVMVVGCKCGKSRIVSQEPDPEYGQYYCVINCEECGYYWEGYMGHYEGKLYGYNKVYEVVALHANDVLPLFADVRNRFPDGPHEAELSNACSRYPISTGATDLKTRAFPLNATKR